MQSVRLSRHRLDSRSTLDLFQSRPIGPVRCSPDLAESRNGGGLIRVWLIGLFLFWPALRFAGLGAFIAQAADRYVALDGTNDVGHGYDAWSGAATQIQWAVDVATNGDTVWVTNGNYRLTNEIMFKASTDSTNVTLKSVNGRDYTFINGNYAAGNVITNRCIMISNSYITIDGFTISNGYATPLGKAPNEGGGLMSQGGFVNIINCTIRNNYAAWIGGGVGGYVSAISNCIVEENSDGWYEGAICCRSTLTIANCIITRNRVGIGSIWSCLTIRNCVISHNYLSSSSYSGVGVRFGNHNSILENCTIVSNYYTSGGSSGGGIGIRNNVITNTQIRNCIIYSNWASFFPDWCTNGTTGTVFYSCCTSTTNGMEGSGNITNWPMFVDYGATNYRLAVNSPCINTGTNQDWMTNSCDFDGRIRIRYGIVDMGAYETIYNGTMFAIP